MFPGTLGSSSTEMATIDTNGCQGSHPWGKGTFVSLNGVDCSQLQWVSSYWTPNVLDTKWCPILSMPRIKEAYVKLPGQGESTGCGSRGCYHLYPPLILILDAKPYSKSILMGGT